MKKTNPIGWSDGNFPIVLLNVFKHENIWLQDGDLIYSAFKVDGKYYASGIKEAANGMCFIMAFGNHGTDKIQLSEADYITLGINNKIPVKVGFDNSEPVYWGLCREGVIYQLDLISESNGNYGKQAKFEVTNNVMEILDNPYWSLDPVWPDDVTVKIKPPTTRKAFRLYNLALPYPDGSLKYPKYLLKLQWEIVEGTTTVKNSYNKSNDVYYLNDAQFRFSQADIENGFILVKMKGTTLKNSYSENTSKIYKIYWK